MNRWQTGTEAGTPEARAWDNLLSLLNSRRERELERLIRRLENAVRDFEVSVGNLDETEKVLARVTYRLKEWFRLIRVARLRARRYAYAPALKREAEVLISLFRSEKDPDEALKQINSLFAVSVLEATRVGPDAASAVEDQAQDIPLPDEPNVQSLIIDYKQRVPLDRVHGIDAGILLGVLFVGITVVSQHLLNGQPLSRTETLTILSLSVGIGAVFLVLGVGVRALQSYFLWHRALGDTVAQVYAITLKAILLPETLAEESTVRNQNP